MTIVTLIQKGTPLPKTILKAILKGYIIIPKLNRKLMLEELDYHKERTLAERGCITFEVKPSREDRSKFIIYAEFIDKDTFDLHQHRTKYSQWGNISGNLKRHYELLYVKSE